MVEVFCSIVAYMCVGEWSYNIIVCCDTILPHETRVCGVLHIPITEQ